MTTRRPILFAVLAVLAAAALSTAPASADGATGGDSWSAYLHGPRHSSDAATSSGITVAQVAGLHAAWSWTPTAKAGVSSTLNASPVTMGGAVYVNAGTGDIYALDEATGGVRWRKVLPPAICGKRGSTSTPTVAADPADGRLTLYVAGADNYLYALDPATGGTRWRSVVGASTGAYYTWTSPTVSRGVITMGVSACSESQHGGSASYDQHTGTRLGRYATTTATAGPNVYTSALTDDSDVYVTTTDGDSGDVDALVRLRAGSLARQEAWQLPERNKNTHFNASPAFFSRTVGGAKQSMVGVCDKGGVYYALRAGHLSDGPVWSRRVGISAAEQTHQLRFCGGSSAYDSSRGALLVGSNQQSLADPALGSVYSLDPQNGAVRWRTSLPAGPVIGSVSVNGGNLVAAPTYDGQGGVGKVYLLNESTGAVLRTLPAAGPVFAQPAFSGEHLLVAGGSTLTAWVP